MSVHTSAGSILSISAGTPATYDAAGFVALTFAAVGEITDLGEFGREYNLVTHNPVGNRGTVKRKGSFNEGQMALKLGLDTDDAGQIICKSASASDNDHSFKLVTQNGDIYYFRAQVMNFKVGVGSVDNITSASVNLELTTNSAGLGIVEVLI
jgi:hypothetical protein